MTSQQKVILGAGAAGAFLLWHSKKKTAIDPKTGKPIARTGVLSKLLPTRGTNSPYVASTDMATRGGRAGAPRPPSSGIGYGTDARGVAQAPSTVGAIALGSAGVLKSLFDFLGRKKPALRPKPSTTRSGSSGGPSGGGGGGGGRQSSPMGGAAGVAGGGNSDGSTPIQGGSFDENGNWVPGDDNATGIQGGSFDENGDWVPNSDSSTPIQGGSFDDNGNFIADTSNSTPTVSGSFDENGNWNPDEDPGVEELPADPLDATPIGTGDMTTFPVDPVTFDSGDVSSGTDDTAFAGVDDGSINGGDNQDNFDYFDF